MTRAADWQSLLFVPVGAERHLASAIRNRPDAVILDLEDAIPPSEKPAARMRLAEDQALLRKAGIACLLRVNAPLRQMAEDIAAADVGALAGILVPKVEDTRSLLNVSELAGDEVPLIALIETPAALPALAQITACPSVSGLMLGSEDYSAALGIDPSAGGLDVPFALMAAAAAVRGQLVVGFPGSIAEFRDLGRYRNALDRGLAMGMNAVAAIHPAQLPVIADVLSPTPAQIEWAYRVIASLGDGQGVAVVDGAMVDAPVHARAKRLLARASRR